MTRFERWVVSEELHDPNRFLPVLGAKLESMVGEGKWLFDRVQAVDQEEVLRAPSK